jgi:hypothetical protein
MGKFPSMRRFSRRTDQRGQTELAAACADHHLLALGNHRSQLPAATLQMRLVF